MHEFVEGLSELDAGARDAAVVMRYILRVAGETSFETIRQRVIDITPEAEEDMASAAEQLEQRGFEKGIERGIEQGIEQGRVRALRETLERLLRLRFGEPSPSMQARIASATAETLEGWLVSVVTADSVDGVFES